MQQIQRICVMLGIWNLTKYYWDAANMMTAVTEDGDPLQNFYYGPNKELYYEVASDRSIKAHFLDGDSVVATYDKYQSGDSPARLYAYIQGTRIDEHLKFVDDPDGSPSRYIYFADGLGSVDRLLDTSEDTQVQYAYRPFGTVSVEMGSSNNPYMYTGREYNNTVDLHYYRARWMDSNVGRFVTKDLI